MRHKILEGDNLYLATLEPQDAALLTKWLNDHDIKAQCFYSISGYATEQVAQEQIERILKNCQVCFAIVRKSDDKLIGRFSTFKSNVSDATAVGGFIGDEEDRGKGYGTEALRLMCDYHFTSSGKNCIIASILSKNIPSIKIAEKVGFKKVGELKEVVNIMDKCFDLSLFQLMKTDFYKKFQSYYKKEENLSSSTRKLLGLESDDGSSK